MSSRIFDFVFVGLGNPTAKFNGTRHNIGFFALDLMASFWGGTFERDGKIDVEYFSFEMFGKKILCLKPMGFMNNSGKVLFDYFSYYKIEVSTPLFVIHDDADIVSGKLRLVTNSGDAGHHGVINIYRFFSRERVTRLRVGIRPVGNDNPAMSFVLDQFDESDLSLKLVKENIVKIAETYVSQGFLKCREVLSSIV